MSSKKLGSNHKAYWLCHFRKKKGVLSPSIQEVLQTLKNIGADGLDSHYSIPEEFSQAVLDAGYEWHVWTVNSTALATELKNRGVASITTDRPKLIADNL